MSTSPSPLLRAGTLLPARAGFHYGIHVDAPILQECMKDGALTNAQARKPIVRVVECALSAPSTVVRIVGYCEEVCLRGSLITNWDGPLSDRERAVCILWTQGDVEVVR